ncbi:hypothetical protein CTRI78_v005036 [Colletotrichum trifolii]|uniref:Uncharacterized protein n=1 Tax=Colletotrichum trifolii TaxID=5466 RepID=A0A4R8RMG5_COLTR|nr:hypothetical protein CTRI78_v005036 [Colletotrichum trifolii]
MRPATWLYAVLSLARGPCRLRPGCGWRQRCGHRTRPWLHERRISCRMYRRGRGQN